MHHDGMGTATGRPAGVGALPSPSTTEQHGQHTQQRPAHDTTTSSSTTEHNRCTTTAARQHRRAQQPVSSAQRIDSNDNEQCDETSATTTTVATDISRDDLRTCERPTDDPGEATEGATTGTAGEDAANSKHP